MPLRNVLIGLLILLCCGMPADAASAPDGQDVTQERQTRKSISHLDQVIILQSDIKLTENDRSRITTVIQNHITMPRFDFNPLPEPLRRQFMSDLNRLLNREKKPDLAEISRLIEQTLLSPLKDILNLYLEQRASERLESTEQVGFAVLKGKSSGLTAGELQSVLNSAYIYIPVIQSIKSSNDKKDSEQIRIDITASLLWYQVRVTESDSARVEFMGRGIDDYATHSIGYARGDGKRSRLEREALYSAVANMARNMEIRTRRIPSFQLRWPVQAVTRHRLELPLGRREGVRLDDRFQIVEFMENANGELEEIPVGFVRLQQVADNRAPENRDAVSSARIVRGRIEEGMSAREDPRLFLDLGGGIRSIPVILTDGDDIVITDADDGTQSGLYLDAAYNMAPWLGISQFFLILGGDVGFMSNGAVDESPISFQGEEYAFPVYSGFHFGILKKFWWHQLGVQGSANLAGWRNEFQPDVEDSDLKPLRLDQGAFCFGVGLEYAFSSAVTLIVAVEHAQPIISIWNYDGNEVSGPELRYKSQGLRIGCSWSPRALPLDPFSLLKGLL